VDTDNSGTITKDEALAQLKDSQNGSFRSAVIGTAVGMAITLVTTMEQDTPTNLRNEREIEALNWVISKSQPAVERFVEAGFKETNFSPVVDAIFNLADKNKDGVLSREEFITYVTDTTIQAKVEEMKEAVADKAFNSVPEEILDELSNMLVEEYPQRFPLPS